MKGKHAFLEKFFSKEIRERSQTMASEILGTPEFPPTATLHLCVTDDNNMHPYLEDASEAEAEPKARRELSSWSNRIKALVTISATNSFSPPALSVMNILRASTLFLPILMFNKYYCCITGSLHEFLPISLRVKCDLNNAPFYEINRLLAKANEWLLMDSDQENRAAVENLLSSLDFAAMERLFSNNISFGTGGIRAKIGPGHTQMNVIVIQKIAQGVAELLNKNYSKDDCLQRKIAIGYDGRKFSRTFAHLAAAVLISKGFKVLLFSEVIVTPVISYTVLKMKCLAGIMITASHNSKDYNGFKLFWENGAQIVSPRDKLLTELIRNANELTDVGSIFCYHKGELYLQHAQEAEGASSQIIAGYVEETMMRLKKYSGCELEDKSVLKFTYTALHGSSGEIARKAFECFGTPNVYFVEKQQRPDPEFKTIKCPNPEEGLPVLELAIAEAEKNGSRIIFSNDGDGDRLGVAEKQRSGAWRIFTGDEIGVFLCYEMIQRTQRNPGEKYAIVNTLVCSQTAQLLAETFKIDHFSANIGYKWVSKLIDDLEKEAYNILCSYEEAHGYLVQTGLVRDKDGISSMMVFMELAMKCYERGMNLSELLDAEIYKIIAGRISTNNFYVTYSDVKVMRLVFEDLRKNRGYPVQLGSQKVKGVRDLTIGYDSRNPEGKCAIPADPSTEMLTFWLENDTVLTLRASGTEPKIKYYIEIKREGGKDSEEELKELEQMVLKEVLKMKEHPDLSWPRGA